MNTKIFAHPPGGLPPQDRKIRNGAVFTDSYAVIPADSMRDIVTSYLPGWHGARFWVLARPISGFAETFSQLAGELAPGGGSDRPERDMEAEAVIFVTRGQIELTAAGERHCLGPGGYAYIPPEQRWSLVNRSDTIAGFQWIRKHYERVDGLDAPPGFVTSDREIEPISMPDTAGSWTTSRFVDPEDLRHDMHVNIVTLQPGARIPFPETHVMEHGLYVLEGQAIYLLNRDWHEVAEGDFMWLRAFCPQACIAAGRGPFRYLLYKDVNRHPKLTLSM